MRKIRSALMSSFLYWFLTLSKEHPAIFTSQFTGKRAHCYFQEIMFSFSSYFRTKTPALIFRRKTHPVVSRRGGLSKYFTLNDNVNELISTMFTEAFLSVSGSLLPDFNNNEDPCCDSTAVMSLSGRESLYRDSSEG